jgi:hypothetical protein
MGQRFNHANQDLPSLLRTVGVDDYTAQSMIPNMMIAPATTDLSMQSVIMTIRAIQRCLNTMGANLREDGELDVDTAQAIQQVTGPGWKSTPWYQILQAIVYAAEGGGTVKTKSRTGHRAVGFIPDLPAMPGGLVGWAALGGLAYYFFGRGKR